MHTLYDLRGRPAGGGRTAGWKRDVRGIAVLGCLTYIVFVILGIIVGASLGVSDANQHMLIGIAAGIVAARLANVARRRARTARRTARGICPTCDGKGELYYSTNFIQTVGRSYTKYGTGTTTCFQCSGTGRIEKPG